MVTSVVFFIIFFYVNIHHHNHHKPIFYMLNRFVSSIPLFYILLLARFARQFYCFTFYYWLDSLANSIVLHSIIGSLRSPILLFYILLLARFARQFYCYVRILYRFVFNFYFFLYTSVRNIYVYFRP
jgi:hypothetical protein